MVAPLLLVLQVGFDHPGVETPPAARPEALGEIRVRPDPSPNGFGVSLEKLGELFESNNAEFGERCWQCSHGLVLAAQVTPKSRPFQP
jgi:hypothetical protein